ncbi:MAG: 1-acyl-sn-glycerol-3-phosphate acyltransferase [Ruminococcaceae bacterium]|nr:1-acyl-sn-glycerol-3-phosphate acyltransferase [Oscillospiraceae bacterium]
MKIKTKVLDFDTVLSMVPKKHIRPKKPNILFRTLLKIVSVPDLLATRFTYKKIGMEKLQKNEPCLYLMNHSSFIDLKIVSHILYPRPFNIVCTSDGFVGKNWLMRNLGCVPTKKFITDSVLVRDMVYCAKKLGSSILIYPEASYTFDGTATPLPDSFAKCVKMLGIPVVMIKTFGAFSRDPLYNCLQRRKVKVGATMEYILSPEDIKAKSVEEINGIITEQFTFDGFRWQQENGVKITENFRADGLNRVLYKCPHCESEGKMQGSGTHIVCEKCGAKYHLDELGFLKAVNVEPKFNHVPDWYNWERECVRKELRNGTYNLETEVDIMMLVDTSCVYKVGSGTLTHTENGFTLKGCDGKLNFSIPPSASYSLYSDYFWYEIGDVICIGDSKALYYCFPKDKKDIVAKTRLATEELYKLKVLA